MNFPNKTPIQVGMAGEFFGKKYRVAGRVVLGEEEAGQIYYWTEFNLAGPDGESADLVFEETEFGPEWRLFILFEPANPITAADASSKRVGDRIDLDGTNVEITRVSRSRIYQIEGTGAEGEDVGDIADYFNAKEGRVKIVVSWTGEEVECYRGEDVPFQFVRAAFKLDPATADRFVSSFKKPKAGGLLSKGMMLVWAIVLVALILIGIDLFKSRLSSSPAPVKVTTLSAPAVKLGTSGSLNGSTWQIQRHVSVQIAEVGRRCERHEYELKNADGSSALLIYGFNPGQKDWYLFTPAEPLDKLTPEAAAAKRVGQTIDVDSVSAPITTIFQTIVRTTDTAEMDNLLDNTVLYGFVAHSPSTTLLARWNSRRITVCRGFPVTAAQVAAAGWVK
jgi:hypothetical protein